MSTFEGIIWIIGIVAAAFTLCVVGTSFADAYGKRRPK